MKIPGFLSATYVATTSAASNFYGWGSSACSSLKEKVTEVAGKYLPSAISNTLKTYPKSFSFVAGFACATVIHRVFLKNHGQTPPPRTD